MLPMRTATKISTLLALVLLAGPAQCKVYTTDIDLIDVLVTDFGSTEVENTGSSNSIQDVVAFPRPVTGLAT